MQHLEEGLIHAWLDGALSSEEGARIEAHARECAECAAMIADARGLIAGAARIVSSLDVVRGNVIPAAPAAARRSLWSRLRLTPARAALAATVLVAVSSLLAVRHDSRDRQRFQLPMPTTAAATAPKIDASTTPTAIVPTVAPAPARSIVTESVAPKASPTERAVAPRPSNAATRSAVSAQAFGARKVSAESLKAHDVNPATAAPRSLRLSDRVTQLSEVVTASASEKASLSGASMTSGFARCYAIAPDSVTSLFHALPPRFALAAGSDSAAHDSAARPVRVVSESGRIDSTLTAGTWRRTSPTATRVDFPAIPPAPAASLVLTAGGQTAEASSAGLTRVVSVQPIDCRE